MDQLAESLGATTIADPDAVPFEPHATVRWRALALSPIPRFLFRLYTPLSDGWTDDRWSMSRDAANGRASASEDVFSTTALEASAQKLFYHLDWTPIERHDNFTSWTSSLLFALQYAFYRHTNHPDRSAMENIRLCVVDTSLFAARTWIRDLDLIAAFKPHSADLAGFEPMRKGGTYYFGEYLTQGKLHLEGKCLSVSLEDMCSRGLLQLRPEFANAVRNPSKRLAKTVADARQRLKESDGVAMSSELLNIALDICCLFPTFPPDWRLSVAINLAGLLPVVSI